MTKPGYTHIIVPKDLHQRLKSLAEQNSLSISQLITKMVNINVNVNVNVGINTSINTLTALTLRKQASTPLTEKPENSCFSKNQQEVLVGLPGFEPGSFSHTTDSGTLREPKSPSLDQASRQPLKP